MAFQMTQGAVPAIMSNNLELKPLLQCIGAKQVNNFQPGNGERFRLALSDGDCWCTGMLATQLNESVKSGELRSGTYIRLNEYLCQNMQGKRIIIVLNMEIVGYGEKVGDPPPYQGNGNNAASHNGSARQAADRHNSYQSTAAYGQPQPTNGSEAVQRSVYGQQSSYGPPAAASNGSSYGAPTNSNGMQQNSAYGGSVYGRPAYGQPQQTSAYGGGQQKYGQPNGQLIGGYGQAPSYKANNSAIARNEAAPKIVPIASLNAYQNRWTIKARVSVKSDMRRWNNPKGEGKFFTVDLLDAGGGEIRAIAFNEQADKFDEVLQTGNVVMISKASLKPKRPGSTYNQTKHDHEITLERQTIVELCEDDQDASAIPQVQYHFKSISEVESMPATTHLDVMGVLEHVDEAASITRKDGSNAEKRNITIKDESNKSIEVTLWGSYASNPGDQLEALVRAGNKPIVAIKGVRVGDYNGKTLSTLGTSIIAVDPDHPQAAQLRNWYDKQGGANMAAVKLSDNRGGSSGRDSRRCTISAIKEERLGTNGAPAYVQVLCYVTMVKQDNMSYPGCPLEYAGRICNKKLTDQAGDGSSWYCERCQQQATPDWRYILSVQADDHTGHAWFTAFQETGLEIIGVPAGQLRELENSNLEKYEEIMQRIQHKQYLFKIKVAEDTYNDETRLKQSIIRADAVDLVKESRVLLDYIARIGRGEAVMQPGSTSPLGGANGGMMGRGVYGSGGGGGSGGLGTGPQTSFVPKQEQFGGTSSGYGQQGSYGKRSPGGYGPGNGYGQAGGYGSGMSGGFGPKGF